MEAPVLGLPNFEETFIIEINASKEGIRVVLMPTPFQKFWLAKLMGFDYEIVYKKGNENEAADAFSRVKGAEILLCAISLIVSSDLEDKLKGSYSMDPHTQAIPW